MRLHDPDILAIQRKRRQEHRCVACGAHAGRPVLCAACRATLRYCARCERVYPRAQSTQAGQSPRVSSAYCLRCHNDTRNGPVVPREAWRAERARERAARVARVARLYRKGLTLDQIAARAGLAVSTVNSVINKARKRGEWPAELRRLRRPKRGAEQ